MNYFVGQGGIRHYASATISWNQISNQPSFVDESTVTTITRNEISTSTIRANQLVIGGVNGNISFNDLSNRPFIPSTASDVGALPSSTFIPNENYITTITNDTITTTNVVAVNLKVKSVNIEGILSANQINTNGLYAERIYAPDRTGNYLQVGGNSTVNFVDLRLKRAADNGFIFEIYDNGTGFDLKSYGNSIITTHNGQSHTAHGSWIFNGNVSFSGSVTGVIARFG